MSTKACSLQVNHGPQLHRQNVCPAFLLTDTRSVYQLMSRGAMLLLRWPTWSAAFWAGCFGVHMVKDGSHATQSAALSSTGECAVSAESVAALQTQGLIHCFLQTPHTISGIIGA